MSDYLDFGEMTKEDWERVMARPPVELEDDCIVIRPCGSESSFQYTIHKDRIRTPADCLVWVLHIGKKPWGNSKILHRVVHLAQQIHGFHIPW